MRRFEIWSGMLQRACRVVAWLLVAVITVLSLVPPAERPITGAPHNLEHLAIFLAAGVAFGAGYSARVLALPIGLTLFSGALELAQIFVPGRHAELGDFAVDAVAACAGALAGAIAARRIALGRAG
jgi:VanZ family protein